MRGAKVGDRARTQARQAPACRRTHDARGWIFRPRQSRNRETRMPNCDAPGSGSDSLRPRSQNVRKRTPSKAGALVTPPTVSRSLRRDTGSTATVNWLPTSYTWSKHFPGFALAAAIAQIRACGEGPPDDRFHVLGARLVAIGLPRQQLSRRARRTTGPPRLSGSHAARGRRHPPRYCSFPDDMGDPSGQERSSPRRPCA